MVGAAATSVVLSARPGSAQVADRARYLFLLADNLEGAPGLAQEAFRFEGDAWYGGGYDRLWVKLDVEADRRGDRTTGDAEGQVLFSRLVAPYWDAQVGVRGDLGWGPERRSRAHLVLGLQGLAPYWFELESALFLSTGGAVSAELQLSYDLLISQRLILEPEIELAAAFQDEPEWGTAAGPTDTEIGVRLRYEVRRELAPYVGFVWWRSLGDTTDLLRARSAPWRQNSLVFGLRLWY